MVLELSLAGAEKLVEYPNVQEKCKEYIPELWPKSTRIRLLHGDRTTGERGIVGELDRAVEIVDVEV